MTNKTIPLRGLLSRGSPDRGTDRTLSAILRQFFIYFKKHELFDESEEEEQKRIKLSLDRAILIGARKITNQKFG